MTNNKPADDRTTQTPVIRVEVKPEYRADVNKSGEWIVWRRISASGWAAHCRCDCQHDADAMAARLNASGAPPSVSA